MKIQRLWVVAGVIIVLSVLSSQATAVNSNSIVVDEIEFYIQTDKSSYVLGEDVDIMFRVTNTSSEGVAIQCNRSGPFNLLVEQNGVDIWADARWFTWDVPTVYFDAGESIELFYAWNMVDYYDNLVTTGTYDVVGVMYNPLTKVAVSINTVPEPCSIALFAASFLLFNRFSKKN